MGAALATPVRTHNRNFKVFQPEDSGFQEGERVCVCFSSLWHNAKFVGYDDKPNMARVNFAGKTQAVPTHAIERFRRHGC